MKLILRLGLILFTGFISISTASAQLYGTADTNAPELRVPTSVKPAFDYWMRDTWATLGPDGYYYITGTTSTPDRYFPGQRHCWDWNDGLYLWRSKDMKSWEARGQIWSMEKDGTWQKKPKVYKAGEKYQKKSINGDPMDNRFHAVWAPEMHYIKSAKNWFIVACMNESAGGRGSFILRSKTGKPEGPYENIEGNKDKAIFPNIDGSLFEDTNGTVYFVGHNHYIARMKPDMSGFAEELKTLKEKKYNPEPYIEGAFIFKQTFGNYTTWTKCRFALHEFQVNNPFPAGVTNLIPSLHIERHIFIGHFFRRMQREMGSVIGQIQEQRFLLLMCLVDKVNRIIRYHIGSVESSFLIMSGGTVFRQTGIYCRIPERIKSAQQTVILLETTKNGIRLIP